MLIRFELEVSQETYEKIRKDPRVAAQVAKGASPKHVVKSWVPLALGDSLEPSRTPAASSSKTKQRKPRGK